MSTALTNLALARSLFSDIPATIRRAGDQRLQLALAAQRRQQDVEDRLAAADLQRELNNLVTQRSMEIERERSTRAENLAKEQFERAIEVEDERTRRAQATQDEQTRRADERAARQAYASYTQLAAEAGKEPRPFDSFGKTPDEIISGLQLETSNLGRELNDLAAQGQVKAYRSALSSLRAMTRIPDDKKLKLAQSALAGLMAEDPDNDALKKALDHLSKGDIELATRSLGPKDRATFTGALAAVLDAERKQIEESIPFKGARDRLNTLYASIASTAAKNPRMAVILGQLEDELAPESRKMATIEDVIKVAAPVKDSPAAPSAAASPEPAARRIGGLAGLARTIRSLDLPQDPIGSFLRYQASPLRLADRNATRAWRTLMYGDLSRPAVGGVERRLRAFDAENPWVRSTAGAVLRSILGPAPQPEPAR